MQGSGSHKLTMNLKRVIRVSLSLGSPDTPDDFSSVAAFIANGHADHETGHRRGDDGHLGQ